MSLIEEIGSFFAQPSAFDLKDGVGDEPLVADGDDGECGAIVGHGGMQQASTVGAQEVADAHARAKRHVVRHPNAEIIGAHSQSRFFGLGRGSR